LARRCQRRGRGWPAASAVTAAAAYGVLQVLDGVALKRAVDAWMAAPAGGKGAAFAAAQAVRWTGVRRTAGRACPLSAGRWARPGW